LRLANIEVVHFDYSSMRRPQMEFAIGTVGETPLTRYSTTPHRHPLLMDSHEIRLNWSKRSVPAGSFLLRLPLRFEEQLWIIEDAFATSPPTP
jgi:hypothetical protein